VQIGIDISRIAVAARTGTEHYTYELLAALARRDRYNQYLLYCNRPPAALPPLGPNFALRRIPFPRLWTHARLSAEVVARPPDLLFIPAHVVPLGVPLRGLCTVVTVHDLGYLHVPDAHTRAQRLYLRLSTAWSARVAWRVIAISAATRDDLARFAGVPIEKVAVVHHGVAPRFRPVERPETVAAVLRRYGVVADLQNRRTAEPPNRGAGMEGIPPYFLYVGTVQPRKNLVRLIEAYASLVHLQRPSPIPQLAIAGKRGWLTEAIERRTSELGVADQVRFTGYVADDDLPALLSGALAFVFPSLYEGFGMPVLEAMACGTPVLTSTTSALPEVAGDAALLVDPDSTAAIAAGLAQLTGDPALRDDLSARGRARAATFTWDSCADRTLAVLHGRVDQNRDLHHHSCST
jgi:glycosyltransferase involved in cell wall biosynthesis